ncbi:YmfQ family protein [Anaerotignum sp. MB30-C6]|uniref:YmfQ family protein n=1 Tax=Anaerotignum sp. MB30-C6 TaxID=3070814 RepID=UPI0027DE702B|nr:YmfQ family protein [Anaerotignum sp. MB30-C6]WMI81607.1 YmfQ family protein [Anaerotignum sp. MB30-C6]
MRLIGYLPEDYKKSASVVQLQDAIQGEWDNLDQAVEALEEQLFIDTATWGIGYWESVCGITQNLSKDIQLRRSAVKAKLRGTGTTTVAMIQNVSESFVNGEVAVVEHNDQYRFDIEMLSVIGIPPNMEDLKAVIEEIKPAHLDYRIIIKYNQHQDLRQFTHESMKIYSYFALREEALANG